MDRHSWIARALLRSLTALSLLLCLASAGLWIDSRRYASVVLWDGHPVYAIGLGRDRNAFVAVMPMSADYQPTHSGHQLWRFSAYMPSERWFVQDILLNYTKTHRIVPGFSVLIVPLWSVQLGCLALPLVWVGSHVRTLRAPPAHGHCRNCGYDLRATPQKGGALLDRCPECGTAVPT